MEKERYYVSVSARMVGTEPSLTDQLTILATKEERDQLIRMLEKEQKRTEDTYIRAQIPFKSADRDVATRRYNDILIDVYRFIYQVGTIETRRHIEYMDILEELRTPDYRHKGYRHEGSGKQGRL